MKTVKIAKTYHVKITMQDNKIYEMHTGHVDCIEDYSKIWKNNLEDGKFLNIYDGNGTLIVNSKLVKSIEITRI